MISKAEMRVRERQLRAAGGQLANCAFNLAQKSTLTEADRKSLDECRRQWDEIVAAQYAVAHALAREAK